MVYEYENRISNLIDRDKNNFVTTTSKDMKDELKEVYSKARAFDEIRKVFEDADLYTDEDVIQVIQEQLYKMEQEDKRND